MASTILSLVTISIVIDVLDVTSTKHSCFCSIKSSGEGGVSLLENFKTFSHQLSKCNEFRRNSDH